MNWFNIIKLFGEEDDNKEIAGEVLDTNAMPNIEDPCCEKSRGHIMNTLQLMGAGQDLLDDCAKMPCHELKKWLDEVSRTAPTNNNQRRLFRKLNRHWDKCNREMQTSMATQRREIDEGLP